MLSSYMSRIVTRNGCKVKFSNMIMGMIGEPYRYICDTEEQAQAFANHIERRDPDNPDTPIGITSEEALKLFGAKKES